MRVSVIVPTLDRGPSLRRTLATIARLDPGPAEVQVVDQTHPPDVELERDLADFPFPLRVLRLRPANAQTARNLGARQAKGEVLLFLDDDVLVEPDLVGAHLANYLDASIGAVGGFFLEPGETEVGELPPRVSRGPVGWIYFPHCFAFRTDSGSFPSCNGSIRREVLFSVGGFDENFHRTLFDDTDLSARLRRAGVRIVHDPRARLLHLKEPSGGARPGALDRTVLADRHAWRTWIYFFWLNFGVAGLPELAARLRGCVLRRENLTRPMSVARGLVEVGAGAAGAIQAMRRGRRLTLFARGETDA